MHKILLWQYFLEPLPFPTQNVSRVREKINVPYFCKSSINYFKTCISTDVRRSKNIQKNIKFGWKIGIQQRPDRQDT